MAIVTVQTPDSLSMSGNLKELILQSPDPVEVKLLTGGVTLLDETYYPGNGNLIQVDFTDVVKTNLSFTLPSSDVFMQPSLVKDFTITYGSVTNTFRCIQSGKLNLTESPTSFLAGNFLTWQPNCKPVTYYSPEWLTYYAAQPCSVRLKAYWENKTNTTITLVSASAGSCYTLNLQYAAVSGKFSAKRPMYYDVWVEDASGTRLSYVQRYVASEKQSEDENWYLFENSLGGLDSLRAYGSLKDEPSYDYNMADTGYLSEEYRVDMERLHTRNTGYLTPEEAQWLQDMYSSLRKYKYTISGLYRIVFTDGQANTDSANLPNSYTFTYRFADTRPYMDIQRRTDLPENLVIPIPTGDTFFLPPRLAEFPKPTLSPDLLLPVQEPHTEVWGTTTTGAIHDTILADLVRQLDGLDMNPIQGGGGLNVDIIKLNDLTIPSDTNVFSALRTLKEIEDATDNLLKEADEMFLRKDIDDVAHGIISFDKNIKSTYFLDGYDGKGWEIKENGTAWLDSAYIRTNAFINGHVGSPTFASGFLNGWGWDLGPYKRFNAAEVEETKYRLELDDLIVRGKLRVFEMIISQLRGENDNVIFAGMMKVAFYDQTTKRLYLDTDKGLLYNPFRAGDILMVQRFGGMPSAGNKYNVIKQYELQVTEAGVGSLTDGENRLDWIKFSNFVGELSDIVVGDVLTRVDSVLDSTRKGIVKITTIDEIGSPYIDCIYGLKTDPMNATKARMGDLSGIRTKNNVDLTGVVGFYAQGAVLENSQIYLDNGMTVEQNFIVMNGKFESAIEGLKNDMSLEAGNILRNSSFSENLNYWRADNTVHFINVGGKFLWLDGSFYVEKDAVADIYRDGSKNVLRILNTTIRQSNNVMNGEKQEGTYSFSFFAKVIKPGTLTAGIQGSELFLQQQMTPSDSYQKISKVADWNGTGDFSISFTGEILLYGVSLFNDALSDAVIKLQTQITQNAEKIELSATKDYVDEVTKQIYIQYDSKFTVTAEQISGISTKVDNINNTIDTAGWITKADGNTLFASKQLEDGNKIISYINQTATTTTISASRVNLYGAVSFQMFDPSLTNKINSKLEESDMGDLAWKDSVSSGDLSYALSQEIANKVSPGALRNYAFATGNPISKSDLASALQTEITNKLTGSSTISGNKLASVIINGQTLIAGGYIQANLINADEIWVTSLAAVRGKIANFNISSNQIYSSVYLGEDYGYSTMTIDSSTGAISYTGNSKIAYILAPTTQYNTSGNSIGQTSLYIRKKMVISKNYPEASFIKLRSFETDSPTFLDMEAESGSSPIIFFKCSAYNGASQRNIEMSIKHFANDDSWIYRTCLRMSFMPAESQVNTESSSGTKYNVKWDSATGLFCI
ncbi:hypothetical protein [Parabacteroides leei]|uniref:hypothetical protein n=1 Tax=Parabacteroides leei TaxID=2939491 RepID=UPI00189AD3CD|nr:hypothetical protein [Parabacteroides goldsteinii]